MAEVSDSRVSSEHSFEIYHEQLHVKPIFSSFICPLSKQIMHDPVTIENGQTFEREAIEKWFRECRERGQRLICPVTSDELQSENLKPSIALQHAIQEWIHRNESVQLTKAYRSLCAGSSEGDIIHALNYIIDICQKSSLKKHTIRDEGFLSLTVTMLKSDDRSVQCKALETLRILAEDNDENKEDLATEDTIRTIIKFLSNHQYEERELSVSLLYEFSKYKPVCEKIGEVNGAILLLVGMVSSKSENTLAVEKAEKTLQNLEICEGNVKQMAENGRMWPLITFLLEGKLEDKQRMTSFLEELVLTNDVKIFLAQTAGSSLVKMISNGTKQENEVALRVLNQISSSDASAKILLESGILPPLFEGLFASGINQLSVKSKEASATILANIVATGADFDIIPLADNQQTLVSEDNVHNLLHLISNTGPATESKLLHVLVSLTTSSRTVMKIVSAIKSSGAAISLAQFIEAPQREIRVGSIKLLKNISTYMGEELGEVLKSTTGQLRNLVGIISEDDGVSEEQAAAAGLLADLPERDFTLTNRLWDEGAFNIVISKIIRIRQGEIRMNRYVNPFLEGLIRILIRLTYQLQAENEYVAFVREHNLVELFADLLQMNGFDRVQAVSATALENFSRASKQLCFNRIPKTKQRSFWSSFFTCFSSPPQALGICTVHHGICSIKDNFCIVQGKVVDKLLPCLDHANVQVVETTLSALCTLLDDDVDIEAGVMVLSESDGIRPILEVLVENRSEILQRLAVWAVERILRIDEIAYEVSDDQTIGSALVAAYHHTDDRTKQTAEKALKHIDKLPNFSTVVQD